MPGLSLVWLGGSGPRAVERAEACPCAASRPLTRLAGGEGGTSAYACQELSTACLACGIAGLNESFDMISFSFFAVAFAAWLRSACLPTRPNKASLTCLRACRLFAAPWYSLSYTAPESGVGVGAGVASSSSPPESWGSTVRGGSSTVV